MFADPVSNLMLIILLFFAGLLVMFVFILRSLRLSAQNHEEARKQFAISLTDLEHKVAELAFALREKGSIEIENCPDEDAPPRKLYGQSLEDLSGLFDKLSGKDAEAGRAAPENAAGQSSPDDRRD